jgi:hypothetical protein
LVGWCEGGWVGCDSGDTRVVEVQHWQQGGNECGIIMWLVNVHVWYRTGRSSVGARPYSHSFTMRMV